MEITILAVGKLRSYFREAADEYAQRLQRYVTLDEIEFKEGRGGTAAEIERDEGRRMVEKLPRGAMVIALSRDGSGWSSTEVARRIERWGNRPLVFALGGSTGLGKDLLGFADYRWSLGPITLPHELARVVVYEQLYRAFTILRGEPYHKGKA
jgi:23S rRNA (pseudouridine1915-N3)-methyltransferase